MLSALKNISYPKDKIELKVYLLNGLVAIRKIQNSGD